MTATHDAILIGAGHNGLTCACYLARAGLRVLVVELHAVIGGMTRSEPMTRPLLVFVNEGGVDPGRVPPGKGAMWILAAPLPYEIDPGAPGAVSAPTWKEARDAYADHVIALAERFYVPGLADRIEWRTVHDPVRMSEESPDCVRGDVSHVGVVPEQSGAMRPVPEMGRYRTPVRGLYLCGSGAHPASGLTLACGYDAAQVILEDLGRPLR